MKEGDKVELAARVLCDPRAAGRIIRLHSGSSRVSVMWQLDNGGVLCQGEDANQLLVASKPDLA